MQDAKLMSGDGNNNDASFVWKLLVGAFRGMGVMKKTLTLQFRTIVCKCPSAFPTTELYRTCPSESNTHHFAK